MASVLAIVSKAVFEKEARGLGVGDVWPTKLYASHNKGLANLAGGGDLYLVTVRGEELWLVAVLGAPKETAAGWAAKPNTTPIRAIARDFEFVHGAPLPADIGKLGMSLQTPRVLSESDLATLVEGKPVANLAKSVSFAKPAKAAKPAPVKATPAPPAARRKPPVPPKLDASSLAKAIAEGRNVDALELALGIWAVQPSAELSELISGLSTITRTDVPNIGGKGKAAIAAWTTAARKASVSDRPSLLERLGDANSGDAADRLEIVARWLPDPRVEALFVSLLEAPPFSATSTKPFWQALFLLMKLMVDPTLRDRLDASPAKIKAGVAATMAEWMIGQLAKLLPSLTEKLAGTPPASPDLAQLASDAKAFGKDPELEALLAAVYADPDADAPRLVYADALTERGDPRGELVTIQMRLAETPDDRALRAREKELLDAHAETWLGPVARWAKNRFTFERGFLATVNVTDRTTKGDTRTGELLGLPIWSTVRALTGPLILARDPAFKALRSYHFDDDIETADWRDLLIETERPLEELWMPTGWRDERIPVRKAMLACKALPKLKSLTIDDDGTEFIVELAKSPVAKRLERLGFEISADENSRWAAEIAALWKTAPVPVIEIRAYHNTYWEQVYTFTRTGNAYTHAHISMGQVSPANRRGEADWRGERYVGDALFTLREIVGLKELDYDVKRNLADDQRKRLEREVAKLKLDRVALT